MIPPKSFSRLNDGIGAKKKSKETFSPFKTATSPLSPTIYNKNALSGFKDRAFFYLLRIAASAGLISFLDKLLPAACVIIFIFFFHLWNAFAVRFMKSL